MLDAITFDNVLRAVVGRAKISMHELRRGGRAPEFADARHVAFLIGSELELGDAKSLSEYLGCSYCLSNPRVKKKIEDLLESDRVFREKFEPILVTYLGPGSVGRALSKEEEAQILSMSKGPGGFPLSALDKVIDSVGKRNLVALIMAGKTYQYDPSLREFREIDGGRKIKKDLLKIV